MAVITTFLRESVREETQINLNDILDTASPIVLYVVSGQMSVMRTPFIVTVSPLIVGIKTRLPRRVRR